MIGKGVNTGSGISQKALLQALDFGVLFRMDRLMALCLREEDLHHTTSESRSSWRRINCIDPRQLSLIVV